MPQTRFFPRSPRALLLALLLPLALLLAACGDDDPAPLEITGTYADNFGSTHVIDSATWTTSGFGSTSVYQVRFYSNAGDVLVARNGASNTFNPGLYSGFSWTRFGNGLYYCQSPFNAASVDDANAATAPDRTNPATSGCGGSSWTNLTP
jgi:hypothetical protein